MHVHRTHTEFYNAYWDGHKHTCAYTWTFHSVHVSSKQQAPFRFIFRSRPGSTHAHRLNTHSLSLMYTHTDGLWYTTVWCWECLCVYVSLRRPTHIHILCMSFTLLPQLCWTDNFPCIETYTLAHAHCTQSDLILLPWRHLSSCLIFPSRCLD